MKSLLPGIWEWSWFSEEKQLDFNGHFLAVGEHRILIDPPPISDSDMAFLKQGGGVDYILITNRDHQRAGEVFKAGFQCRLLAPGLDAKEMTIPVDGTFQDGELLPGGIWVIHLQNQKSPGECALFLQKGKGILIVGDALIGAPAGKLRLLPPDKYADQARAKEGLRRLLKYQFETLLVGDGASILSEAKPRVEEILGSPEGS